MNENQRERYIRWQGIRIGQLSYSINLLLGISIASLGFVINLKLRKEGFPFNLDCIIICWSTSTLLGFLVTFSRLLDFRYTAQKIISEDDFNTYMAKSCGPVSWGLFWAQIISYVIGAFLFVSVILTS